MTKEQAIIEAIKELEQTGITQFVDRRGDKYAVHSSHLPSPIGWKTAEMISKGNVHAYKVS